MERRITREARKEAYEGVEAQAHEDYVFQKKPNTLVVLRLSLRTESLDRFFLGLGFSKVCWPDTWNEEYGKQLAHDKAVRDIYQQVIKDPDFDTIAEEIVCPF